MFDFELEHKFKRFWKWFEYYSDIYFELPKVDGRPKEMLSEQLTRIDPNLNFAIDPDSEGKRKLILYTKKELAISTLKSLFQFVPELKNWNLICKF